MAVSEKKKIKYDGAYISYVKNGESAAVFITRDLATEVPTGGMWVDVVSAEKKVVKMVDGISITSLWSFFHGRRSLYIPRMHLMVKRNI